MEKNFNGWTNYETWKVNLEFFSKNYEMYIEVLDFEEDSQSKEHKICDRLEMDFVNFIDEKVDDPVLSSICYHFASKINYYEIALHIVEEHSEDKVQ
tara:strand:+ start:365 stop:655 length:291 start_codon:yes stop_codon:yes gene_type:complete